MNVDCSTAPCFAGVSDEAMRRLNATAHHHQFQAGAAIFAEGARCAGLHIVVDGLVRLYRISPEGRMHTLSLLRPRRPLTRWRQWMGGPILTMQSP